jgi:hypothetical protein
MRSDEASYEKSEPGTMVVRLHGVISAHREQLAIGLAPCRPATFIVEPLFAEEIRQEIRDHVIVQIGHHEVRVAKNADLALRP